MNPVKFLGIMCMCFGVATMFLGTAMVPVAAPVWGDVYEAPPGGGPANCNPGKCNASCGTPQKNGQIWECKRKNDKDEWIDGTCRRKGSNCSGCPKDECEDQPPIPPAQDPTECDCAK